MLTIITLEIFNSGKNPKNFKSFTPNGNSKMKSLINLNEEQITGKQKENIENFIRILPVIILAAGIIVMYILDKIYFK